MKYHLIPVKVAMIKKPTQITCVSKDIEKREPCTLLVAM